MKIFSSLINENDNSTSVIRWATIYCAITATVCFWYPWMFASIWKREIANMPGSLVEAYLGTLAICFAGKVAQKFAEIKQQKSQEGE